MEYVLCETCGNDRCPACGELFQEKPLHIFWGECICVDCQGPELTDEEIDALFEL